MAEEPLIGSDRYDYADAFEIRMPVPDPRSAEEFGRFALEDAPSPIRWTIWIAHRYLLRFRLGPRSSPDHILGWRILVSEPDVVQLEAVSPLLRGVIVGRKPEPNCSVVTTYIFYKRPVAGRVVMKIAGPIHRRIAPYLLEHAAAAATEAASEK
ncbi:MAG: DUF2867 domain-containing protein [Actinomycetota bacterium]|nr:DUF2867 domain-containing protein [Actinomycetota bacterium]